jgi:hypothetical protein
MLGRYGQCEDGDFFPFQIHLYSSQGIEFFESQGLARYRPPVLVRVRLPIFIFPRVIRQTRAHRKSWSIAESLQRLQWQDLL